jgi:acyl carrier protein
MSETTRSIEHVVIAALRVACRTPPDAITGETEVLEIVDSLGFFTALLEVQYHLEFSPEPVQIVDLLRCRTVKDLCAMLEECVRLAKPEGNAFAW